MQLHFGEVESTFEYFEATRGYLATHGRPVAFYSDKAGVFRVNAKQPRGGDRSTQFSRAMGELSIDVLATAVPRFNTVRYAGVLAAASKWRPRVVPPPAPAEQNGDDECATCTAKKDKPPPHRSGYRPWAELLKRTFRIDVELCSNCGGRLNRSGKVQLAGAFHGGRWCPRSGQRRRRSEDACAGDHRRRHPPLPSAAGSAKPCSDTLPCLAAQQQPSILRTGLSRSPPPPTGVHLIYAQLEVAMAPGDVTRLLLIALTDKHTTLSMWRSSRSLTGEPRTSSMVAVRRTLALASRAACGPSREGSWH